MSFAPVAEIFWRRKFLIKWKVFVLKAAVIDERILLTVLTVLNVPLVLPPLALVVMLVMLEAASMVSSVKLLSASPSMQVMSWFHVVRGLLPLPL